MKKELNKVIVGNEYIIELLATSLLAGGHTILEGLPGVAKTTIAKAFSKALNLEFSRIQLTPDILPADIIGCVIYDQKISEFKVKKGPIFSNIVLADEINRAMPKTQSALLEAMQELQVTIEGETYELPKPFMVIATMNPIETEGVFPLPEAQLDRFMLKIKIGYLNKSKEIEFLKRKNMNLFNSINKIVSKETLFKLMDCVKNIKISDIIIEYIYDIVSSTRNHEKILIGASPRASEHMLLASKALAFLRGRAYVIPDDVKEIAKVVLPHRLKIKPEYEVDNISSDDVIREVLSNIEVPK